MKILTEKIWNGVSDSLEIRSQLHYTPARIVDARTHQVIRPQIRSQIWDHIWDKVSDNTGIGL